MGNSIVYRRARISDLSRRNASHSGYVEIKNDRLNIHNDSYLQCRANSNLNSTGEGDHESEHKRLTV